MSQRFLQRVFGEGSWTTFTGLITPMPGCPDLAVSHGVFNITPSIKGLGKKANWKRQEQVSELGYSAMICTVDEKNIPQIKILEGTGWVKGPGFTSLRTGNRVLVYIRDL